MHVCARIVYTTYVLLTNSVLYVILLYYLKIAFSFFQFFAPSRVNREWLVNVRVVCIFEIGVFSDGRCLQYLYKVIQSKLKVSLLLGFVGEQKEVLDYGQSSFRNGKSDMRGQENGVENMSQWPSSKSWGDDAFVVGDSIRGAGARGEKIVFDWSKFVKSLVVPRGYVR